ncbi:MAG: hypothetical protein LUF92_15485 [Clostridiales bacterium]|nr:hypothetical protein [Clostridiales bacterium]
MISDKPFDRFFGGIITLNTAVARNGLTTFARSFLDLATDKTDLKDMHSLYCRYIYYPVLDREHFLEPEETNPALLLPTVERSLVDYIILQEEYGDEGILIESLQTYLYDYGDRLSKLYEIADVLGLKKETLDYWLNEAREESDMSMG